MNRRRDTVKHGAGDNALTRARPKKKLGELANLINVEHAATVAAVRKGIEHARRAGELLNRAKAICKHGEWLPWLVANVRFTTRQAQKCMLIASRWSEIVAAANTNSNSHLGTIDGALAALSALDLDGEKHPPAVPPKPDPKPSPADQPDDDHDPDDTALVIKEPTALEAEEGQEPDYTLPVPVPRAKQLAEAADSLRSALEEFARTPEGAALLTTVGPEGTLVKDVGPLVAEAFKGAKAGRIDSAERKTAAAIASGVAVLPAPTAGPSPFLSCVWLRQLAAALRGYWL